MAKQDKRNMQEQAQEQAQENKQEQAITQEQAQEQAQENKQEQEQELVEYKPENDGLSITATQAFSNTNTRMVVNSAGKVVVSYYNAKGEENTAVLATKEEAENVYYFAGFSAMRGASTYAVCYELAQAERSKVYERFGFKSVEQFAESIASISSNTCKQYVRVGKAFMRAGENGARYALVSEYLKGASVANLMQCLSLLESIDNAGALQFVADYVETGDIPITATLAMVKRAVAKIRKGEVPQEQENKQEQAITQEQAQEQAQENKQEQAQETITDEERKAVITGALDTAKRNLLALLGKDALARIEGALAEVARLYM